MIKTRFGYTLLLWALLPQALLHLLWRARRQPAYLEHVGERFGRYSVIPQQPLIWVHAVSVGETRAAEPLIGALQKKYPQHRILLTHMTPTGRETGETLFGAGVQRCYLPYDFPFAVARFLDRFKPVCGVLLETEVWPDSRVPRARYSALPRQCATVGAFVSTLPAVRRSRGDQPAGVERDRGAIPT
jgi:3-deoxy-D-manno-octulosonic-acid transferase